MRKSTVSQNNSGFPIRAVIDMKSKNQVRQVLGKYQKQFDKTGRPKRPADIW
jgi:hypothetical protein